MSFSAGLLFGILAMLGWGIHKILAKKLIDRLGPYEALVYGNSIFVGMIILYSIITRTFAVPAPKTFLLTIVLAGIACLGVAALYKAMHIGKVSIVVPVSHVYAAIIVVVGIFFFGEVMTRLQFFAVFLAIAGTILVSFKISSLRRMKFKNTSAGIPYALVTIVCWGLSFALIKLVIKELGPFVTMLYFEVFVLAFLLAPYALRLAKLKKPSKKDMKLAFLIGLVTFGAEISYYTGLNMGLVSIIGPISACALMVTVLLSWLFLGEKIDLNQKIAIAMIFAGILLLAL